MTQLVALLQVADGLDRSHGGAGPGRRGVRRAPAWSRWSSHADDDIDLELWGLRRKRELFERVFGCRLEVVDAQLALPSKTAPGTRQAPGRSPGLPASVAGHLRPGDALVGPDVAGQAEHPLARGCCA